MHGFIWDVYHDIEKIKLNLFWSKDCDVQLHAQTYIKTIFDDFLCVLIFYAFAKMSLERSMKVYMISVVWMLYHIADIFCFLWNYKQDRLIYLALTWCMVGTTIILILPKENKMKMVK